MSVLKIKDENGNFVGVKVVKGEKGEKGDKGDKGDDGSIAFIVVTELPTENIDTSSIYMKPTSEPETENTYEEYIYVNGAWEHIGSTKVKVDLTEYAKTSEIPTKMSELTNDSGFITDYTESDPTVPSHVKNITEADITKWNAGGSGGSKTRNVITVKRATAFTIASYVAWDLTEYPFTEVATQVGENLSLDSNGRVVIGAGIDYVKVSLVTEITPATTSTTDYMNIHVRKMPAGSTSNTHYITNRMFDLKANSSKQVILPTYLIPVQEGDSIYTTFSASIGGKVILGGGVYAYMTVEAV